MGLATRLAALGLVVLGGCGPVESTSTEAPCSRVPEPVDVQRWFTDVVARYREAELDGLSPAECTAIAAEFEAIHAADPTMLVARFNVGALARECGDKTTAEQIHTELALRGFEPARDDLATIHREQFEPRFGPLEFEAAEQAIVATCAGEPVDRFMVEDLARWYDELARFEDPAYSVLAELALDQALATLERHGQPSALLWVLMGARRLDTGDPIAAREAFERAVAIEPEHPEANRNLGILAVRVRRFDAAERAFTAALRSPIGARDIEVQLGLAVALRGLGRYDDAEARDREAMRLDPEDPRPWFNLAVLDQDHRSGDDTLEAPEILALNARAKRHCEQFIARSGPDPRYLAAREDCADRIEIIDEVEVTIRYFESMRPQHPSARLERLQRERDRVRRQQLLELEARALGVDQLPID